MAERTMTRPAPGAEAARRAVFRRNLMAVGAWELFWGFGAAFVTSPIVTAFALQLTPSKAVIGLLGLMQALAVPTLVVSAYLNRRLRRRRAFVALAHMGQVLTWVVLGLFCLRPGVAPQTLLAALIAGQGVIYLLSGLLTAPSYELLSRAFGRRYGTATGVQLFINRTVGMVGGLVAQSLLAGGGSPADFGRVFLIGGGSLLVSNLAVFAMVEPRCRRSPDRPPAMYQATGNVPNRL